MVNEATTPEVIDLGDGWVTVRYHGSATAYFRRPSPYGTVEPELIITEIKQPPEQASDTIEPESPTSARIHEPSTYVSRPSAAAEAFAIAQVEPAQPLPPDNKQITRFWEGKIVPLKGLSGWFTQYDYILEAPSGRRIAYLDTQSTLLFKPIDAYLGIPVVVSGMTEKITGSIPLVIYVRFIRLLGTSL